MTGPLARGHCARSMEWIRDHAREHLDKHLGASKRAMNSVPENGGLHRAGADWTPHRPPYDVNLPVMPVSYTEEDKAAQREAGKCSGPSRDNAFVCVWGTPFAPACSFVEV